MHARDLGKVATVTSRVKIFNVATEGSFYFNKMYAI